MAIIILIQRLICFRNNGKRISSFEPTTAQLYQKQYQRFGWITSIKIQSNVIYSTVTAIAEYKGKQVCKAKV